MRLTTETHNSRQHAAPADALTHSTRAHLQNPCMLTYPATSGTSSCVELTLATATSGSAGVAVEADDEDSIDLPVFGANDDGFSGGSRLGDGFRS
jgi:hypothetical protein